MEARQRKGGQKADRSPNVGADDEAKKASSGRLLKYGLISSFLLISGYGSWQVFVFQGQGMQEGAPEYTRPSSVASGLLETFSQSHNESLLWGTWRPGIYVGVKSRTYPSSILAGLMWTTMKNGAVSTAQLRHTCEERETQAGLQFSYPEHNGHSYARQLISDKQNRLSLQSTFVKEDPHSWALQVHGTTRNSSAALYFYLALEDEFADEDSPASPITVESLGDGDERLVLKGQTAELGDFRVVVHVNRMSSEAPKDGKALAAWTAKAGTPVVKVKEALLEGLASERSQLSQEGKSPSKARLPPLQDDRIDGSAKIVVVQALVQGEFQLDVALCSSSAGREDIRCSTAAEAKAAAAELVGTSYAGKAQDHAAAFKSRFDELFKMKNVNGVTEEEKSFAVSSLSTLLGGVGFFYGSSQVRLPAPDADGEDTITTAPRPLFTAVPSRSFFPRGFLWDEGFHQLLLGRWNPAMSRDAISHWFGLMQSDGWIPREQILGAEALSKVPDWAVPQHPTHANPPTLLLAIESLLQHAKANGEEEQKATDTWLRSIFPAVQHWFRWLLESQRGQEPNSFRWHGRDPNDGKLNAMTLSSGLDDYPRAAAVSDDERHVDLHCWIAFGAGVLARVGRQAGAPAAEVKEFQDLQDNLIAALDGLHWDEQRKKYSDFGLHCNDGGYVPHVVVKCRGPQGKEVEHTVEVRKFQANQRGGSSMCPSDFPQYLFPLGDGKGGLLMREKFVPKKLRLQFVDHTGYVTLFPLFLRLLPADSPKLGSLLDLLGNPDRGIWSDFGLRSLSSSDKMYLRENAPGDAPYWRGPIWINCNFLAVSALKHYAAVPGPYQAKAADLQERLARNLMKNMYASFKRTGWLWEQYNPSTGDGQRTHPFAGWSALISLIISDAL